MKVYGYDNAKRLLAVDLPIEKVVAAGIDPWRVDVFDEDPVTMRLGWNFRQRHFRKLRDVSFSYWDSRRKLCFGIHDGCKPICLVGVLNEEQTTDRQIVLSKFSISDRPFAQHFAEFLGRIYEVPLQSYGMFGFFEKSTPRSAAAVTISGSALRFDNHPDSPHKIRAPQYVGNMLVEMTFHCALPKEINWVFDHFDQWKPIVWGEAISQSYRREPIEQIEVALHNVDLNSLKEYLRETGFDSDTRLRECDDDFITVIKDRGCRYHLTCDFSSGMPLKYRDELVRNRATRIRERLYAMRKNEITGSRVALFDLANSQMRSLNPFQTSIDVETVKRKAPRKSLLISDPAVMLDLSKKAMLAV